MFQNIEPHRYNGDFTVREPAQGDYIAILRNDALLTEEQDGIVSLPHYDTVFNLLDGSEQQTIYLFSVDETAFFLSLQEVAEVNDLQYRNVRVFLDQKPGWRAFASATAFHFARWYDSHRYCGRCAAPLAHKDSERAVYCPRCGTVE